MKKWTIILKDRTFNELIEWEIIGTGKKPTKAEITNSLTPAMKKMYEVVKIK